MENSHNPTGNKVICYFCLMLFTLSMLIVCSANSFPVCELTQGDRQQYIATLLAFN